MSEQYNCSDCKRYNPKRINSCGIVWNHWTCSANDCPGFELRDYKKELQEHLNKSADCK